MKNQQNQKHRKLSSVNIVLYYALFAALWIAVSDKLLNWLITDREWLTSLSIGKGFLFVAITSFLLYLLLNLKSHATIKDTPKQSSSSRRLIGLFAFQILLIPLIPALIYNIQGEQIKENSLIDLNALAKTKTEQIENWLHERLSDGLIMQSDQAFSQAVALLNFGGSTTTEALEKPLTLLLQNKHYNSLLILDQQNTPRVIYGHVPVHKMVIDFQEHNTLGNGDNQTKPTTLKTRWYWDENNRVYLDIQVPIIDARTKEPVGTLIMSQDLQTNLLPLIKNWPSTTHTGNTYLLQPHDDQLSFIALPANDVLHTKTMTLSFNKHTQTELDHVMTTKNGSFEGKFFDDHDVIASYTSVQHSGWYLLVTQNKSELFAPLYTLVYWVTLVVFFASLMVIFVVSLLWKQQQHTNRLELQRQTSEKDRLLRHFFDLPLFGMAITHSQTGRWIRFNDQLAELLGYSRTEMAEVSLADLTAPAYRAADIEAIRQMELDLSDGYQCEKQLRHKDGRLIDVNIDTRCVRTADRNISFIISVVEDISQRKASELELRHQKDLYDMLSQTNQSIVRCKNQDELFTQICEIAVEHGQFIYAWISQFDPQTQQIAMTHAYGDDGGFTRWMMEQAQLEPDFFKSTPVVQALVSGKNLIINDCQHSDIMPTLHDAAAKANISASSYFMIRLAGEVIGSINLYASAPDFFTPEIQTTLAEIAIDVSFALDNLQRDAQLKESEHRFRTAIMNSPSPMVIYTQSGKGLTLNRRWAELSGYTLEDIPYRSAWEKVAIPLAPHTEHFISDDAPPITELVHNGEFEIHCKNGSLRYWDMQSTPLGKDTDGQVLLMSMANDITERKAAEAQLAHLAHHDPLTQLPNRTLLGINLNHAIELAARNKTRVALMMLDLDRFKNVNDSFGHQIGDVLLQEVAQRLLHRMRTSDTICRLGGDEFTILIEGNAEIKDIEHIAEDILQLLKDPFHLPNGRDIVIGVSIGISLYPEHGLTQKDLLKQADAAMYRAKAQGRNCFRYFSDDLTLAAEKRLDMELRLRKAIEQNELRVYFQPQIDIKNDRIIGAEALVRWQDPQHGLISPALFIPVAEETGLIKQLGEWVLMETCRQGYAWLQQGLPAIHLAVNISPVQFHYSNIKDSVINALNNTGFPPSLLELELTESALMAHETEAVEILNALREYGVRLAIDDFGTGYSSLSYLKLFPLDVLKIDKSFVDDIPHKKSDMEIAAAIVAMAHTLQLNVLAEGVETQEQLAFLKEQGCDCYQGYLMSPPVPAEQFEKLLRTQAMP
ncbi:bifunctional diguanylate cyclase/phosphodiesterase [Tolumonas lignilytica]|uniref:bifunctional diguanylate cyclase/phosphodiesterase n=1 Tax=Tolumonas lignilytica TaxID=1283284 RepID=UPI0004644A77|nr:EAL domain-containing protein [Tolumonas lignilytica]